MHNFSLMIPMLNAEKELAKLLPSIARQTLQPQRFLVIDSSSDDNTVKILRSEGVEVIVIDRKQFNHGGTRMQGVRMLAHDCDIVIFMTQDAILNNDDAFENLIIEFDEPTVASAYGRQVPHEGAGTIEAFSRLFNYGEVSERLGIEDIPERGFRTSFCSNTFAAYRVDALLSIGGMPSDTIFGEDALVAAELILEGNQHAYVADAIVQHSHSYTIMQEFKRYFDVGVMHKQNRRLIERFGSPAGAGRAFVISELRCLLTNAPLRIPEAILRTSLKLAAYRLGLLEEHIPISCKKKLSMHRRYWNMD